MARGTSKAGVGLVFGEGLIMSSVVFMPTVPSSGTTFLKHFFQGPDTQVRRLSMVLEGRVNLHGAKKHTIVHTHFMYHIDNMEDIWGFDYPTVIPMRDPLASLLTFSAYDPISQKKSFRIENRMDEFFYALQLQERCPVIYVPVDIERTEQERYENLKNASYGIVDETKMGIWAKEWPVHNSKPNKGPKTWYAERDLPRIKSHLMVDGRWQQLKQNENKVRPYLERLGYTDLMWYE